MKLGEFFIDLFVNANDGTLTLSNLVTGMGELEVATVGEIAVLWQLGVRLAQITDYHIKLALGLEDFTSTTGESAQQLQKWKAAAELARVGADTVTSSFKALAKGLEDMKWGQASGVLAGAVQILGIDPTGKDVFQVMDDISNKLREKYGKDQKAKEHVLGIIGFDPSMIRLLDRTAAERDKMAQGAPIIGPAQEKLFLRINDDMALIERKACLIGLDIATWTGPEVAKGLEAILGSMRLIEPIALRIGKIIQLNWKYNPLLLVPKLGAKLDDQLLRMLAGEKTGIGSAFSTAFVTGSEPLPGGPMSFAPRDSAALYAKEFGPRQDVKIEKNSKFYINGVNDPEAVARTVDQHQARQNDDTEYLLDRGVLQ